MKILTFALVLILCCCNYKQNKSCQNYVELIIENKDLYDSKVIFSNGKDSIKIEQTKGTLKTQLFCFSESLKNDGNYKINLKNSIRDTTLFWGYYSNGIPSENTIKILLTSDSINIKSIGFK
jgi:hypothetical protein